MNRENGSIKRAIIRILILGLTASYCTLPLLSHWGLPYAQDMVFHIFQADQFTRAIYDGIFSPKWVLDSNNGYGSPSFVFYAPLSYYVVAFIKLFIPSLVTSVIVAVWCSFFLSGVTMFIATRKLFGDSGSLLSAMLYQILPFHLLDLYLRGAFAELFAFVWFPLILLHLHEIASERKRTAFIALSLSYAGLILTHLASGFIFSIAIIVFLTYRSFLDQWKGVFRVLPSLALGAGLASSYFVPAALERRFVQIEYLVNCPVGDYKKNFLFVGEKFDVKLGDFYFPLHIGVILEVLFFLFLVLSIRRNWRLLPDKAPLNFFVFLFLFALFLTTPLSRPVWDLLPGFPTLQFPWRWLTVVEVSLCFLLGAFFSSSGVTRAGEINLKRPIIYFIITLLLMSFVVISRSKTLPEEFVGRILNPGQIKCNMDPPIEYTPVWVKDVGRIMSEAGTEKISIISGSASAHIIEWKSERRTLSLKASAPSIVRISTFYYPGWQAWIDGNTIQIEAEEESGAMLLEIGEGEHILELKFCDTRLRFVSKIISAMSLLILVALATWKRGSARSSEG